MVPSTPRTLLSACALVGLAAALGGCMGSRGESVALAEPVPARGAAPAIPIKTVRRTAASHAADPVDAGPVTVADAMPSPSQIFDFHPPGSKPDAWREPFVIDYTDGPLNRYRVETATELKRLQANDARPQPVGSASLPGAAPAP